MYRNIPLPHFDFSRVGETLSRIGHGIARGYQLTDALFGIVAGTGAALAAAAVLRLPDVGLLRLAAEVTAPAEPPAVGDARSLLLALVFGGLIWAASSVRKTREWFKPASKGVEL